MAVFFTIGIFALGGWYYWRLSSYSVDGNHFQSEPTRLPNNSEDQVSTDLPDKSFTEQVPTLIATEEVVFITPTPEDESLFTFSIKSRPENINASLFNQEHTCNWMGVAGQAFDIQGRPIPGITVQVSGPLHGKTIQFLSMTGSALSYGEGGYEIFLDDKPEDTMGEFDIRLVDQLGRGLSPRYSFNTYNSCEKNLAIINFKQIK